MELVLKRAPGDRVDGGDVIGSYAFLMVRADEGEFFA
jgi:hypothetical protein